MSKNIKKPNALKSLGEALFLKVPLYEAQKKYSVLYVNETLFAQCYPGENTGFSNMAEVIRRDFSTTLDPENSTGKRIGFAYVDKQADPLGVSLNGNLGSGRAFYQGEIFNIKGEKTPLVRSQREQYSNGILELEKAMFETIASNSLFDDLNIRLTPILAILDIEEECTVYWKNKICKRAKVIRLDWEGSLNRISHIFQSERPLTKKELLDTAKKIGALEGEKFIHRIEHGAWSAGNISEHAHMIDFDTVCATRYRAPQFSFTQWFIDNYFGLEYLGQLRILKSLTEAPSVNVEHVSNSLLEKTLLKSRTSYINEKFPQLMGFGHVAKKYHPQIDALVRKFMHLSTKCYPEADKLELKFLESLFCSPFNFSKFFRHYPILKRQSDWSAQLGLEYLVDCVKPVEDFDINAIQVTDEEEKFFKETVLKSLDSYFIHSYSELIELTQQCLTFIQDYDELYTKILSESPGIQGKVETRAYILNQDRIHLMMPYSIAGPIDDERDIMPSEQVHNVIKTAILSNKRNGESKLNDLLLSNMALFKEGYFATLHNNNNQHRLSLNFFIGTATHGVLDGFEVEVNDKKFTCRMLKHTDILSIQSPFFDNDNLLSDQYRTIHFYKNGEKLSLQNFLFSFVSTEYTDNFAASLYDPSGLHSR